MRPIVFTQLKPSYWQFKTALTLRKRGHKTELVSLLEKFDREEYLKAYDKILCPGFKNLKVKTVLKQTFLHPIIVFSFLINLLILKPRIAICEGPPHYLSAFFIWFFRNRCKRVYFPYDMVSSRYKEPKKYSLPREIWGEDYSFRNCDAIIYKSAKYELNLLPKKFKIERKLKLGFPSYAQKDLFVEPSLKNKLSRKDKKIHLVNAGTYTEGTLLYLSMADYLYNLLKLGFQVHFFSVSQTLTKKDVEKITKGEKELEKSLHVSDKFFSPKALSEELSKYDYGLNINYLSDIAKDKAKEIAATNKLASYLEAGIPIFINKEVKYFSNIVNKNGIGLVVEKKDMSDLKEKVKKINYSILTKNVLKFREKYSMESHIDELIEFINRLSLS